MAVGLLAGLAWAIETIIMGIALACTPFVSTEQAVFLAPFVSTFLHDSFSALWMFLFNGLRREIKGVFRLLFKTKEGRYIALGGILGGPIGMTGYMFCINNLGASIGSVASAIYPAVGAVLAHILLKEKLQWYRWIFLLCSLGGIAILGYSPGVAITNFALGVFGALIYSLGNGVENIILAKCLKNPDVPYNCVLNVRQLSSGIVTGLVLVPIFGGWGFTCDLIASNPENVLFIIAIAALFGTISFLAYSISLMKIGVAKSLALNGLYPAWAIFFSAIIFRDMSSLTPITIISSLVVVVFGILVAVDFKDLFGKKQLNE